MNPKITWVVIGIVAAIGLGYLASRVGNIGARGVRGGHVALELSLPGRPLAGVNTTLDWPTPLGEAEGRVVVKARGQGEEVVVGEGEFGAGQVTIVIPCPLGGQEVGIALYRITDEAEELLNQRLVEVLPAGQDCVQ